MTPPIGQIVLHVFGGTIREEAVIQKRIGDEQCVLVWHPSGDRKTRECVWVERPVGERVEK